MSKTLTLKPGGACRLPSVVVFVDCKPTVSGVGNGSGAITHSFGVGHCTVCRLVSGKLSDKSRLSFNQPWIFWQLLSEIRDKERATWIIGHNIGYDLTLLGFWDWLPASGARLVSCCLDDPPTIVTLRWGRRLVRLVDVMNYWRLSVADLAGSLGQAIPVAHTHSGRQYFQPGDCEHDVGVIESCMLRLISHLAATQCSSLRPTAASLSWGVYRKSFQPRELVVSLGQKERYLARQAYYGGRVQEFISGSIRETVHGLDCNSMYPSVMMNNLFPCRLVSHPCGMRPADLAAALRDYDCVADVDLRPGEYPYPCRSSSGVAFVRGCTHAILAGAELRVASAHGDVTKVRDCYLYERADLFSGFVKHFYRKRTEAAKTGNRGDSLIYKMFLNCLHGKFAQRGHKWTPSPKTIARGYYAYWWHKHCGAPAPVRCRSIAGVVEAQEEGEQPRHCFPAISACITANARVVLEDDISTAGPHNVLYCDTDSLHVVDSGRERLERYGRVDATKLGRYRVHVSGNSAHYYGRQHYRIGDHMVCSAIKPDAIQISDGVYLQDSYQGVERVLEAGTLDRVTVTPRVIDMLRSSKDAKKKFVQCS